MTDIFTGLEALLIHAQRLGLTPVYRLGSVLAASGVSGVMVVLDNDTAPVRCFNFMGPLLSSQRVLTVGVKPQGIYVIGAVPSRRTYALTYLETPICDTLLPLTNVVTDLSGTTLSVLVSGTGAKWEVEAFYDAQILAANTNTARGYLNVDGVDQTATALHSITSTSSNNRSTIGQTWSGTFTTPAVHTFKLRGDVTAGTLQWRINNIHTKYTLKVFE